MLNPTIKEILIPYEDIQDIAAMIPMRCKYVNYTLLNSTRVILDCDCTGKEFTVSLPTIKMLVGGLNFAYINLHPSFYYYQDNGKCSFRFTGTTALSGSSMWVLGQPFYNNV
jgi:hypothetical protein